MLRIGTRGSALALAQAEWVRGRLGVDAELVTVLTSGDRGDALEDKSRWVSELERALLEGRIEVAVHSAKDVPAALPDGLELVAIPARADPRDAICGSDSLAGLQPGSTVGTSSIRRAAQLRAAREDLDVVPIRGNVDTRLRQLAEGQVDALVLAMAGLQRLGRTSAASATLDQLVPAAGQGALALEARPGVLAAELLARIADDRATACVQVERELVRALGASCETPIGAHARALAGGGLELRAWVGLPDGSAWVSDLLRGPAAGLGQAVAGRMRAAGAAELLDEAARQGPRP